jgi:hypothetical protein
LYLGISGDGQQRINVGTGPGGYHRSPGSF